ncbi:MAG: hypothetical protein RIS47_311, partial [Bacteroidota bacterium]
MALCICTKLSWLFSAIKLLLLRRLDCESVFYFYSVFLKFVWMGGFGWSKLFLRRVLVVACVSLVLFVGRTVAQDAAFRFEQLSVSKGLSQSWVTSMVQDSYGFVWLGTGDGLNMFNGYSFKVYKHRPEDAFSLPNNYILSLLTDRDGNLWVGSMGGVSRFDRAKDRFVNYAVPGNNGVFSILQYGDFLWLGTGSGIYIFDLKTGAINLDLSNKLSLEITWTQATNLLIDKKDRIWICGMNGLYMFDMRNNNNKSTRFLAGFDVRDGVVDFRGDLWFGTRTNGVFQVDAAGVFTQFIHRDSDPKSLSSGAIISMEMDKNYNIWFGSENGGLNILPRTRILSGKIAFDHYLNVPGDEYSVSSNSIHHILCDKRGDLWLGTYGGGVDFVRGDGRKFKLVHHIPNVTNSLIHNYVNAFLADGKDFWVGTEGGASCFDRDKSVFTNYVHEPQNPFSLSKNAVWCMVKDPKGYIWMSTWAGGVNRLDLKTKRFTHYLANDKPGSVLADEVFSCMIDKDGDFWCTPMGKGICRYDWNTDSFVNYHHDPNDPNSLGSDWTQQIYENSRGEIWIATTSGVSYFNKKTGKFTNFYDQTARNKTVSGNGANVVFEDTRGTMWFGTNSGLNYFVRSTASFSLYSEQDGLPNNTINSILEDGHGNLWLGTNKGLSKFENAIRLPKRPRFRNFDANDGLQDNEFVRRSAYKDTQGYMYFGGINGYNYFHPDSIIENKIVPSVMLTSFNIFNKQIDLERDTTILESHISIAKQIVLPYEKSVFSFEFAALNYVSTPKNNYAYMLEGFDTNWNYIGTRRSVTYTNLKEGHYVFRVKASNNDGLWNESPTSIDLIILPPWWRSIWAYIFYVLFLGSFVSLLLWINQIRVSEKQQIKLERLKSSQEEQLSLQKLQFFTNISHEFRTPLTLIVSPLDDILKHHIKELPTAVREKLKVIYKNTSRMGRLIDELMDFRKLQFDKLRIKPAQHEVGNFVRNIAAHFSEEVVAAQIEFRLNLPE